MKSLIAALQSLVLPFGATSGRRIILDGVNGEIAVYDASGTLRLRLGGVDAEDRIRAYTGDVAEQLGADFATAILGAGADRQLALFIDAPQLDGQAFPSMTLISQSFDGTVLSNMQYAAARHDFMPAADSATTDITVDGESIRFHQGSFDVTTAGDAKATITHGAGFTPSSVLIVNNRLDNFTPGVNWWTGITGVYTSTTFKAQFRDFTGAALVTSRIVGRYICFP